MRAINVPPLDSNYYMNTGESKTWKPPVYTFKRRKGEHKGLGSSLFYSTALSGSVFKVKGTAKPVDNRTNGETLAPGNQWTASSFRPRSPEKIAARLAKSQETHLFPMNINYTDIPTAIYVDSFVEVPVDPPARPANAAKKIVPLYLQRVASPQIYTDEKFSPRLQGSPRPCPKADNISSNHVKTRHDNHVLSPSAHNDLQKHDTELRATEAIDHALRTISLSSQPLRYSVQDKSSSFSEYQQEECLPTKTNPPIKSLSHILNADTSPNATLEHTFVESFEEPPPAKSVEMINKDIQVYGSPDLTKPRYCLLVDSPQLQPTHKHIPPPPPLLSKEFSETDKETLKKMVVSLLTPEQKEDNTHDLLSTISIQAGVDEQKQNSQSTIKYDFNISYSDHTINSRDWSNSNLSPNNSVSVESIKHSSTNHSDVSIDRVDTDFEEKISSLWEDPPELTTYTTNSPLQPSAHTLSLSADEDNTCVGTSLNKPSYCVIEPTPASTTANKLAERPHKLEQQKHITHPRPTSKGIELPPPCSILAQIKPRDNEEECCTPSDNLGSTQSSRKLSNIASSDSLYSSWEENSEKNPYLAVGEAYRDEEHHTAPLPSRPRENPYLAVGEAYRDEPYHLIYDPNGRRAKNPYWGIGAAFWSEPYHIQARREYVKLRQQENMARRLK